MSRGFFMRLKLLRKQKHMSQLSLAMKLNTTQMSISRYETGKREPDLKTLILIADFFDVSIDYLLERTDNPKMNK
jgi:transcriptional regulator with XRE-family HTH domain